MSYDFWGTEEPKMDATPLSTSRPAATPELVERRSRSSELRIQKTTTNTMKRNWEGTTSASGETAAKLVMGYNAKKIREISAAALRASRLRQRPPKAAGVEEKAEPANGIEQASKDAEERDVAILSLPNGQNFELPIMRGSMGPAGIDVRGLLGKSGFTTYDPGFTSTCSCHSAITFIDGPGGRLMHRGYNVMELCEKSDFMELSYLLMYSELPNRAQKEAHVTSVKEHMMVQQKMVEFFKGYNYNAHPMAMLCGTVGALSAFYHESLDIRSPVSRLLCAYRLIAKMPTIAAMTYKHCIGQPVMYPKKKYSYAGNFLYMMFATPMDEYVINPVVEKAIDVFLMLHADHEQNASASTVRIAGSSQANPFACIASGICSLWGPAHGGANEAVLRMLREIGSVDRIPLFIEKAKDKKDPFRLMGFGHRVYKNYDPRARIMKKMCDAVLADLNIKGDPLLDIARELERIALEDEYFKKRRLFPNVDFYSGIVLKAIGIPISMFTVMFALARTVGWISQWKEMIEDPKQRIGRPRQVYVGAEERPYVPMDARDPGVDDCEDMVLMRITRQPSAVRSEDLPRASGASGASHLP